MAKNFKTKKLDRTNNGRMLAFFLWWMATALAIVSVWVFAQEAPEDGDESLVIEIGTDFDPNYVPESTFNAINSAIYEALSGYAKSSDIEQQFTELVTQIESTYATKNNLDEYVKTSVVNDLENNVSALSGQMSTVVKNLELNDKIQDYIRDNACDINNIINNGVCGLE